MTNNDESTRSKIIYALLDKEEPINLTELSKELKIDKELAFHHLKKMKDDFLVAETDEKKYTLQPFFYDENLMEILNCVMKSIVLTILKELKDTEYTEEQLEDAVKNNLQLFIETFAINIS